jgi:hypothetical protein
MEFLVALPKLPERESQSGVIFLVHDMPFYSS